MKNSKISMLFLIVFILISAAAISQSKYFASKIVGGVTCLMVSHEVSDFKQWHEAYLQDLDRREKNGIEERFIMRGNRNSNHVTVIFEIKDLESAKSFFEDPSTAMLMHSAGVLTAPKFTYFKVNNSGIPNGDSFLIIQHDVEDYPMWKQAFDKHQNVRTEYGLTTTIVGENLENPKNVIAVFNSVNPDNFSSFLEQSDLKEAMKDARVSSEPNIIFLKLHKE